MNSQSLDDFNEKGFEYGNEYEVMLKTKDGEWMQYVVHSNHGTQSSQMGMLECDGKVTLFPMDFDSADFKWKAPAEQEITADDTFDGTVVFTTSYAPAYTQAFIQSFTIKLSALIKQEL